MHIRHHFESLPDVTNRGGAYLRYRDYPFVHVPPLRRARGSNVVEQLLGAWSSLRMRLIDVFCQFGILCSRNSIKTQLLLNVCVPAVERKVVACWRDDVTWATTEDTGTLRSPLFAHAQCSRFDSCSTNALPIFFSKLYVNHSDVNVHSIATMAQRRAHVNTRWTWFALHVFETKRQLQYRSQKWICRRKWL